MAKKIYNNGSDGKILMSSAGKIIRQPYEFGNAFQNKMGLNNYIEISGLNLSQYYSIFNWNYRSDISNLTTGIYNVQNSNLDNYIYRYYDAGLTAQGAYMPKNSDYGATSIIPYNTNTKIGAYSFSCAICNSDNVNQHYQNSFAYSQAVTQTNLFPITKIWLGAHRNSNGATPNNYTSNIVKINRFTFFNRQISSGEYLFAYNNKVGNDFQSNLGIEIDLLCNFAEILDFSMLQNGSDMRVGCRDYSGYNRHGEIINLPAGTLQQKLYYANANLFVQFIS